MTRYRGYNRRRSNRGYTPAVVTAPVDELYERAYKLSEDRNKLNYDWVSDCGPDAVQRQIAHYTQLIALVGEADKAWRAVAERDGVPYTPCVDCGWLPRYTAALELWRARFIEQTAIGEAPAYLQTEGERQLQLEYEEDSAGARRYYHGEGDL